MLPSINPVLQPDKAASFAPALSNRGHSNRPAPKRSEAKPMRDRREDNENGPTMFSRAKRLLNESAGFGRLGIELHVVLQAHPFDHVELRFEELDMLFLAFED